MAKTKVSEWSTTPSSNTDIDGINIAEGCAPSGINDAIRDMMAQIRSWQSGTYGDTFNGPVNGTVGATTPATGAFTTLSASSTVTLSGGTANGVTYLNGSKVLTSGSALTFDGTSLVVGGTSSPNYKLASYSASGNNGITIGNGSNTGSDYAALDFYMASAQKAVIYANNNNLTINASAGSAIFQTGSTEQMRLTSTGLGIGTSSVTDKLTVAGNISTSNNNGFSSKFTNGASYVLLKTDTSNIIQLGDIAGYSKGGAQLQFFASGSVAATFDQSGNLGLGVTPSAWGSSAKVLELPNGTFLLNYSTSSQAIVGANAYYTGSNWIYKNTAAASNYEQNSGAHKWFNAPSGTAGNAISFTQAMTMTAAGNLLVGTTSDSGNSLIKEIILKGPSNGVARTQVTTNSGVQAHFGVSEFSSANIGFIGTLTANPFQFLINDSEVGRFDTSGNWLVGTTSTSFGTQGSRMLPSGQVQAVSASSNDAFAGYRQTTTAGDSIITGYSNVGGTQVLKFNAMADGNVRIAAGATYGNISDRKYKTNIVDATPKLQDLMQLRVRNFNVSGSEQKAIGFIAQEFETVFPSLVIESVDKDFDGNDLGTTTKGIKESALLPVLVKAIQELKAEFDAYKASHP